MKSLTEIWNLIKFVSMATLSEDFQKENTVFSCFLHTTSYIYYNVFQGRKFCIKNDKPIFNFENNLDT